MAVSSSMTIKPISGRNVQCQSRCKDYETRTIKSVSEHLSEYSAVIDIGWLLQKATHLQVGRIVLHLSLPQRRHI